MARALVFVILTTTFAFNAARAQQQPKPISSIRDVEPGMPRDYVLVKLLDLYKLKKEAGPLEAIEAWEVRTQSMDLYLGEIVFKGGKLWAATQRLWARDPDVASSDSGPDFDLAESFFNALSETVPLVKSAGASPDDKWSPGGRSKTPWTRRGTAILETSDTGVGNLETESIKIAVGSRLFVLAVNWRWSNDHAASTSVTFDEVLVSPSDNAVPK